MSEQFRLALLTNLSSTRSRDVWQLPTDRTVLLGRRAGEGEPPEVDLWPDMDVSCRHAHVWYAGDAWHIRDLGSAHGTLVDGRQINGLGATRLSLGAAIRIGSSVLMVVWPGWHRLRSPDLVVDFEINPAVNLALGPGAPLGEALIADLVVTNASDERTGEARLAFSLSPLAEASVIVPALGTGESRPVAPRVVINYDALENRAEGAPTNLSVTLDGQPLCGDAIECWVLAYNEWSAAAAHWAALAAFVLPNNPRVAEVAGEVAARAELGGAPENVLAEVYAQLHNSWNLGYQLEPPTAHAASRAVQKIRLPHQVLDPLRRSGAGTCIDLAVLVAACLEHLHVQPLIAVLDTGTVLHALVGCWLTDQSGVRPVYAGDVWRTELLQKATWVDVTGSVRDMAYRLDFATACAQARHALQTMPMVFTLDVGVARRDGYWPLPFAGEPVPSRDVDAALRAAEALATEWPSRLGTVPLLLGLIASRAPLTARLLEACGDDVGDLGRRLLARLPREPGPPPPSQRYHDVVNLARSQAKREGSPRMLERHLLRALLDVGARSEAFGHALRHTRTDLETLRGVLSKLLEHTPAESDSVFSDIG